MGSLSVFDQYFLILVLIFFYNSGHCMIFQSGTNSKTRFAAVDIYVLLFISAASESPFCLIYFLNRVERRGYTTL